MVNVESVRQAVKLIGYLRHKHCKGTLQDQCTPVRIPALTGVIEIAAGDFHSLAIVAGANSISQVYSWGCGKNG